MAGSHVTVGSGDHHVLAIHGWFGSARGWGSLIVGVNDPALSANLMEQTWCVTFPMAELTILPDAGHYPMFESPVSLATSIEEFLGRG